LKNIKSSFDYGFFKAVIEFQKKNELSVDGLLGKKTASKINMEYDYIKREHIGLPEGIAIGMLKNNIDRIIGSPDSEENINNQLICNYGKCKLNYNILSNGSYELLSYEGQVELNKIDDNSEETLKVWIGMSKDELISTMGHPMARDEKISTWYYDKLTIIFDTEKGLKQYFNSGNDDIWNHMPIGMVLNAGDEKLVAMRSLGAPQMAFRLEGMDVWVYNGLSICFKDGVIDSVNCLKE
jgi:hypothetical protein